MKHFLRAMLVIAVLSTSIFSCKRESLNESNQRGAAEVVKPGGEKSFLFEKITHYRATPAEIDAAKKSWLAGIKKENVAAKGACGTHVSDLVRIISIVTGSCGSWTIEYLIMSYDQVGSGYDPTPITATFSDINFQSLTATQTSQSDVLVDPNCTAWQIDAYCDLVREYTYEVSNIPYQAVGPLIAGYYNLQLLSGFSSSCTPLTVSGNLPGSLPASFYSNNIARAGVPPSGTGSIFVSTDCSILCYHPYVCPSFGTFQYWPVSNPSNVTNLNIPAIGTQFNFLPGNYGYSVTLSYTIGGNPVVSQPKTGTFTIL